MIRMNFYNRLKRGLYDLTAGSERLIGHVGLWNQNVEFLDQEEPWARPAVFVEFGAIRWRRVKCGDVTELHGDGTLRLHVVTDYAEEDADQCGSTWDAKREWGYVCAAVGEVVRGMGATDDWRVDGLAESHTNHNHEELVETIEVYAMKWRRIEGALPSVTDADVPKFG